MAKPTGPLLSFGASGQIAKTAVFSRWKGRPYVRRHVVPANPQTAEQSLTRDVFTWASNVWKQAPALLVAPWDRFAVGQVITGRNHFMGSMVTALRGETDLANMVFSPGAKGGLPPSTVSAAAGVGEIVVTFTTPTPPTGWTIQAHVAACIKDQDPNTDTDYLIVAAEDAAPPLETVTLPGLDTVLYQVGGWLRWLKPDGSIAYGPSLIDTATPT